MTNISTEAMNLAVKESKENSKNNYQLGGPFGAVIVKDNKIIAANHNTVIESKDPTAHAEINAIRKACKILNTHDLSNCIIYSSSEPCPMCLAAIIWANIKEVYFANTKKDVNDIGFKDELIYDYFKGNNKKQIKISHIQNMEALEIFKEFKENKGTLKY